MIFTVFFLSACEEERSKKFYLENENARTEKLEYCKENIEERTTPNCLNAEKAKYQIKKDKFKGDGIKVDYSSLSET